MTGSARPSDPRLMAFLSATDDAAARDLLNGVLEADVIPVVRAVVRRQLTWRHSNRPTREDLEDVEAGVLLRVSRHLLGLRRDAAAAPVSQLADYVAATTYNACASFLEERHPARTRLRYRLRYVATHDERLALWEPAAREWRTGLAEHRATANALEDAELIRAAALDAVQREGRENRALPRVLRRLFATLGGPCGFNALVDALAIVLAIDDVVARRSTAGEDEHEIADSGASSLERLEGRELFTRMWGEIRELPRPQRVALLLSLRDGAGQSILALLVRAGVASEEEVSGVLQVSAGEVEALLPTLPREDALLASFLGCTPRQVINLRKAARARLGRRLRELRGGW